MDEIMYEQLKVKDAQWRVFPCEHLSGTETFGIRYHAPEGQHILCTGMYRYQAEWLVMRLNTLEHYIPRLPHIAPEDEKVVRQ